MFPIQISEQAKARISIGVLVLFGILTAMICLHAIPDSSQQVALVLLGALATHATTVVNYWIGSSAGSARKMDIISQQIAMQPVPDVPPENDNTAPEVFNKLP